MTRNGHRIHLFGRPLKPVLLWSAITMAIVAQANLRSADRGIIGGHALILGLLGAAALALIVGAWIRGLPRLAEWGLLLVGCVWLTRTLFIWLTAGVTEQAGWYGLAAALLAFTSFAVERVDRMAGGVGSDGPRHRNRA